METGTIPDLELIQSQLAEITATSEDGEHLVVLSDYLNLIRSDGTIVSPQQASGYLGLGEWEGSHPCTADPTCVLWTHVTTVSVPMTEEEEDLLVAQASRPSLATLYRQARATGLVPATPSGYF